MISKCLEISTSDRIESNRLGCWTTFGGSILCAPRFGISPIESADQTESIDSNRIESIVVADKPFGRDCIRDYT